MKQMKYPDRWRFPTAFFFLVFLMCTISGCQNKNSVNQTEPEIVHSEMELNVPFIFYTAIPEDFENVREAFDCLAEKELGIHVNLIAILSSAKTPTVTMMKNEGISFDVFPTLLGTPFSDEENLLPLDQLLYTDGKGILKIFSEEELSLGEVNRTLLKLPNKADTAEAACVVVRKDLIEKYGITQNVNSLEELDQVLEEISEKEPQLALIAPSRPNRSFLNRYYTWLSIGSAGLVLMDYGDAENPEILYETKEYQDMVTLFYKWSQNGWLPNMALFHDFPSSELVKNEELLGYFCHYKPGVDTQESMKCGYEMEVWLLTEPFLNSPLKTTCSWSISRQCENPKQAMQLLNFMYTSQEAMNLLNYGIAGENYQVDQGGNAVPLEEEKIYYSSLGWELPNQYLCFPWGDDPSAIWEETQHFNETAYKPQGLGFSFDQSEYTAEISAMQKAIDRYAFGLETGNLNPQKYLPEFLDALREAGMEKVKAAAIQQYKNWGKET